MSTPAIDALQARRRLASAEARRAQNNVNQYQGYLNNEQAKLDQLTNEIADIDRALAALSYGGDKEG